MYILQKKYYKTSTKKGLINMQGYSILQLNIGRLSDVAHYFSDLFPYSKLFIRIIPTLNPPLPLFLSYSYPSAYSYETILSLYKYS